MASVPHARVIGEEIVIALDLDRGKVDFVGTANREEVASDAFVLRVFGLVCTVADSM